MVKKLINNLVICAPNINEGGPLTILNEAINSAKKKFPNTNIIIIANSKKILNVKNSKRINILEFPNSKKSWMQRLIHEYYVFKKLSVRLNVDIWISLQDVTTIVQAKYQTVYCHCPIPFYNLKLIDIYHEPSSLVRNLLYNFIYKLNIYKNDSVIVQQEWLRKKFEKITNHKNIIVARPVIKKNKLNNESKLNKKIIFIYPTLPRFHKNIELICEAIKLIDTKVVPNFEVKITIKGNENRYASILKKKYSLIKQIKFIGNQSRGQMKKLYSKANALIFPSKLETWGLPISEAIDYKIPIMVAKLEYARETLGSYKKVSFFQHDSPNELSEQMKNFLHKKWKPSKFKKVSPKKPLANDWNGLWDIIRSEYKEKNAIYKK